MSQVLIGGVVQVLREIRNNIKLLQLASILLALLDHQTEHAQNLEYDFTVSILGVQAQVWLHLIYQGDAHEIDHR